jgi:hypothetical protein
MKVLISLIAGCLLLSQGVQAQPQKAKWGKRIATAIHNLECQKPDEKDPVALNAVLVKEKNGSDMTVIVKTRIKRGWHLYALVPPEEPFIITEGILILPKDVTAEGDWVKTPPTLSPLDKGVFIWEQEVVFTRRLKAQSGIKGILEAGLFYQACDWKQCLPPVEKTIKLKL